MWSRLRQFNASLWDWLGSVGDLIEVLFGKEWKWTFAAVIVLVIVAIAAGIVVIVRWLLF